jgi:ribulose kinase
MDGKYATSLDFGIKSGRALAIDAKTGETAGLAVKEYDYGVMDYALPDGTLIDPGWALQHSQDYLIILTCSFFRYKSVFPWYKQDL